jgi:phosphatidylserine/phosphatidylglycerophosphate/cardiolipin synthase-like enzyme
MRTSSRSCSPVGLAPARLAVHPITGSYNFTPSAEKDNDENLVIVDDPALARAYLDEFARVCAGPGADTLPVSDSLAYFKTESTTGKYR